MEILSPSDILVLKACLVGGLAYTTRSLIGRYAERKTEEPDVPLLTAAGTSKKTTVQSTKSILEQLDQQGKTCMVFYGSQTGTAERLAHRFAREALSRYALGCVVADLDDYDFEDLARLSRKQLIVLVLATYGEGEPTDNAIAFRDFLAAREVATGLENLCYSAFGLGSSSYTHFNAIVNFVDEGLTKRGACRIGSVGMGDDGKGTLEEDFILWTNTTLPKIAEHFDLGKLAYVYSPAYCVSERLPEESDTRHVFLGEPNKAHLYRRIQGPYTAQNPFPASIANCRELYTGSTRSCLHIEFDVSGTSISYDTGDHLAVWPVNSDLQVNLFLKIFGLSSKRSNIIDVVATSSNDKAPVPGRTTYESAIRSYLDICAVVTRYSLRQLSDFAKPIAMREKLLELADNQSRFAEVVTSRQLTISQLLDWLGAEMGVSVAIDAPFSLILELFPRLKPRYYSISSSSLKCRKAISITVVVDSKEDLANGVSFRGVSTSYLSALKSARDGSTTSSTHCLNSSGRFEDETTQTLRPLIHIRRSKFRPPFDARIPIIMIGPGTGIAPFRGFMQERALQRIKGREIGRTMLFYGCRSSSQEYLYEDEWRDLLDNNRLGEGVFSMHIACSRENGRPRQYVQDLIQESESAKEIRRLLNEQNGRVYICGNAAGMAKDVSRTMGELLTRSEIDGVKANGPEIIAQLKKEGRWFEDVW